MKRRNSRSSHASSGEGEFLWLMSLSDLMLLLFVFFVVLFSFTYKKLGEAELAGIASALRGQPAKAPPSPLEEIESHLNSSLSAHALQESVEIVRAPDHLRLEIKEKILFASGDYRVKTDSETVLKIIAQILAELPATYRLGIEGHTDDIPLRGTEVRDNWELSTRRALSVLYALKLDSELMHRTVVMGFGEMSPRVPNRDSSGQSLPENQAKNRRVTLRVFRP